MALLLSVMFSCHHAAMYLFNKHSLRYDQHSAGEGQHTRRHGPYSWEFSNHVATMFKKSL